MTEPETTMSEREKMLAGELYRSDDPELLEARRGCQEKLLEYNATRSPERRRAMLEGLFGSVAEGAVVESPLACDYGSNISIGIDTFVNYGAVILDGAPVGIGDKVQIATGVQLLTAEHPIDPVERRTGIEIARPIRIADGAWLGGGVIVCPGVTIGEDAVIGAGSVVTRDIPPAVVAVGNPCRVMRPIG